MVATSFTVFMNDRTQSSSFRFQILWCLVLRDERHSGHRTPSFEKFLYHNRMHCPQCFNSMDCDCNIHRHPPTYLSLSLPNSLADFVRMENLSKSHHTLVTASSHTAPGGGSFRAVFVVMEQMCWSRTIFVGGGRNWDEKFCRNKRLLWDRHTYAAIIISLHARECVRGCFNLK